MQLAELNVLAQGAQHRGGRAGRRRDGAFFTDADVAHHLARRAILGWLLTRAGVERACIDELLAAGGDLWQLLVQRCDDAGVRDAVRAALASVDVLDPSCGAGSFLIAAWTVLVEVDQMLDAGVIRLDQLHGVDIDAGALEACQRSCELVAPDAAGSPRLVRADAVRADVLCRADVVLGNPPFIRARTSDSPSDLSTRSVPNVSAWVVERALRAARPDARVSFVLPISTACTDSFAAARASWNELCASVLTCHFDTIPASLFDGVVQRISIFEGRRRAVAQSDVVGARWWTSTYHRWLGTERAGLLDRVRMHPLPKQHVGGSIAKIGSDVEAQLLEQLLQHPPAGRFHVQGATDTRNRIYYKRRWSYFLLFTDFVPGIWSADGTPREPSELKHLDIVEGVDALALLAVYSSTLFWWYFSVFTDNRNVNIRDLAAFPVAPLDASAQEQLAKLGRELMAALHACGEVRTCTYRSVGTIRNTYYRQAATRHVLDRIDAALADAYGLSAAQLEFVLAYERRFRSG